MARVVSNTYEDTLRRVRRWYCKHYYVPLHLVEDITDEELLVEFFEHNFEEMDSEERVLKIKQLLLSPEEMKGVEKANSDYDAKLLAEMEKEFEEHKAKKAAAEGLPTPAAESKVIKEIAPEADISVSYDETPEDISDWD